MPSPWAPHAPLWVLCLQFPELRRLRPRPDRLLLVSSPEGCLSREPKPCWPGAPAPLAAKFQSRRGAEHLGVEQQVSASLGPAPLPRSLPMWEVCAASSTVLLGSRPWSGREPVHPAPAGMLPHPWPLPAQ